MKGQVEEYQKVRSKNTKLGRIVNGLKSKIKELYGKLSFAIEQNVALMTKFTKERRGEGITQRKSDNEV